MDQDVISARIELIGLDEFKQIVRAFKQEIPQKIVEIKKHHARAAALHSMKGMCYACGLDRLGNHIAHIERMVNNGADSTAYNHIQALEAEIKNELSTLEMLLDSYQT
jgi:HPt (histidine-containing phosphotransfer) domain-containing protein